MSISINGGANVINLATKASEKVVERFKIGSCTEGLFTNEYSWKGVRTVEVRSIDNLPLNDYNATLTDGTSRFGALTEVGDTIQTMTVAQDKSFNGVIDKANNTSVLMTKAAGKVLRRQTDEVLIPYVDKYRLDALAKQAGSGYFLGATTLSSSNIIEHIMKANALMSNNLVPDTGRVLYMGYTLAVDLKLASQVVGIDKLGEQAIVNGVMGKVDKCQVRLVPDNYMPAGVNFMIVKTGVACAPKKIETYRVLDNVHIVDGSLVQGRLMHDLFVLAAKNKGVLVCMAAPASVEAGSNQSIVKTHTYQLAPTMKLFAGGADIDAAQVATYASATTANATVDANGLITVPAGATTNGTSVITVTVGTATDTMTVTATAS